jgi:hypothetical protein
MFGLFLQIFMYYTNLSALAQSISSFKDLKHAHQTHCQAMSLKKPETGAMTS